MRLSLMVMAYRERVFLQELEADKAKRSLSAQEKMALAAGHASLKRDAGRVRQKLALVDRQRAERLDELKQLYSDMARVPKVSQPWPSPGACRSCTVVSRLVADLSVRSLSAGR